MIFIPIIVLSLIIGLITFLIFIFFKNEFFKKTSTYCLFLNLYFFLFYTVVISLFLILSKFKIYTIPHSFDTYLGFFLGVILIFLRNKILFYLNKYFIAMNIVIIIFGIILGIYGYVNYNPKL